MINAIIIQVNYPDYDRNDGYNIDKRYHIQPINYMREWVEIKLKNFF